LEINLICFCKGNEDQNEQKKSKNGVEKEPNLRVNKDISLEKKRVFAFVIVFAETKESHQDSHKNKV
jgi:hypothetical protein